jgi:Amt family ammonium transporter
MTLLGALLLWFGWFGFNGGSALAANGTAVLALVNSQLAAAAGALSWMVVDVIRFRRGASLGFASGFIAGLATVTPTAGFVGPMAALCIGTIAGLCCYGAVVLKERFSYDDSLDVFGIHGVGGLIGMLLLGVFATKAWNAAGANGLITGETSFFGSQVLAVGAAVVYSVGVSLVLLKIIGATVGLRVRPDIEREGLDMNLHGEVGYALGASSLGHLPSHVGELDSQRSPVTQPA